jgi:hypothetical protein
MRTGYDQSRDTGKDEVSIRGSGYRNLACRFSATTSHVLGLFRHSALGMF